MSTNMKNGPIFTDSAPFKTELLSLGEGQIGYVRELAQAEIASLPIDITFDRAWAVYSATGEPLALCDSPNAAWSYFADHELAPVSVH